MPKYEVELCYDGYTLTLPEVEDLRQHLTGYFEVVKDRYDNDSTDLIFTVRFEEEDLWDAHVYVVEHGESPDGTLAEIGKAEEV